MSKEYNPLDHSIVQACLKADGWQRYEATDFIEALLRGIVAELDRCYWNVKQEQFSERRDWQFLEITGFAYRRYFWGDCDCGAEEQESKSHLPTCSPQLPNMQFEDVCVSWYKHLGRGMSVSVDWPAEAWKGWFERCLEAIRQWELDSCEYKHDAYCCTHGSRHNAQPAHGDR